MPSVSSAGVRLAEIETELAPDLRAVEDLLARQADSRLELIEQASQYLYRSGGKRIRPMMLLLAARAAGDASGASGASESPGQPGQAPSYGAVVEMIHTATLVHDDIVDAADTRRGRESLNNMLGNDLTVLIGDYLYIRSMSLAVEMGNQRIVSLICDLTLRMIEGMLLEMARGGVLGLTREEHLNILRLKTACLFQGCGRIGAAVAEAPPEVEEALGTYGLNLGMAFQVADDLFDFTRSADEVGKPVLTDLKEGHLTLPILYALEREPGAAPLVEGVLDSGRLDAETRAGILSLVERRGGLDEGRRVAAGYAAAARGALAPVPSSRWKDALEALTWFVISRGR